MLDGKINHLDLFSGVGGFSLALERAIGKDNIGWVGYSDIDKYANQVYKEKFPYGEELGTIVDIRTDNLPERIDLITFGFPCQDLSIAGKQRGFKGERSSLFYEATRIIRATRPKYFIFENVKGAFSSNKGEDFTLILQEIADLGYDGQWQLLNSRDFGVPQNRERIYFIGYPRGGSRPEVFPIRETDGETEKEIGIEIVGHIDGSGQKGYVYSENGISSCLTSSEHKQPKQIEIADYRNDEGLRIRENKLSPCLASRKNSETDISTMAPLVIEKEIGIKTVGIIPESDKPKGNWLPRERVLETENGISRAVSTSESQHPYYKIRNPYNGYESTEATGTLGTSCGTSTGKTAQHLHSGSRIRRLTPKETCRLQSFPDDWNEGQSDTQRYKQMGNAITVNVAEAIFRRLYNAAN